MPGCLNGGMVDTRDLKSLGHYRLCGFESHFRYNMTDATSLDVASVIIIGPLFLTSQNRFSDGLIAPYKTLLIGRHQLFVHGSGCMSSVTHGEDYSSSTPYYVATGIYIVNR